MPRGAFDPIPILDVLLEHDVEFVLIGGLAGNALGSPSITSDVDICYERSWDNLGRLAAALGAMDARLRGAPERIPFVLGAQALHTGDSFTFVTRHGWVDVLATPFGTRGYREVRANASEVQLGGRSLWVCELEDLMRMKTAAGRPKDRIELEVLGALRDELEGRPKD